jgi:poly(hydroxyalkanoate) depolymerase family esterase
VAKLPRLRLPLGKTLPDLAGVLQRTLGGAPAPAVPQGAGFLGSVFTGPTGSRPFKLFVPSGYKGQSLPLVVMLHGCTQSPDGFAAGTRMNEAAEADHFLVLYPAQTASANASKCWNWFNPRDQMRDQGEPALIAGMTRLVMNDYKIDPRRVYVAGLSAGGAAAAIMAHAYPELFAAACIHSGLACGAATDMMSAMRVMHHGPAAAKPAIARQRNHIPVIIFQGDHDSTVHASNTSAILDQFGAGRYKSHPQTGKAEGGHAYSRTLFKDEDGITMIEQWMIHGAGHAWSGGSKAGSFTNPMGPNATQEMLRFFRAHPKLG